jgi:hypothetical protein
MIIGSSLFFGTKQGINSLENNDVKQLKKTDKEVRDHEAAHLQAAGSLATGGASYTLAFGSNGKEYAVAGSVQINTSEGKTPQETMARAQSVKRAALAPASPSSQDYKVANKADIMFEKAQTKQNKLDNKADCGRKLDIIG